MSHIETEIRVMIAMYGERFVTRDGMLEFLDSRKKRLESTRDRLNLIAGDMGASTKQDELIKLADEWIIRLSQT